MYSDLLRYVSYCRVESVECLSGLCCSRTELSLALLCSVDEGPMTLRLKFPRPRLECQLLACGYQVVWAAWSTHLISQLSALHWTDWCTREFLFSIVSSSVSQLSQFSQFSHAILRKLRPHKSPFKQFYLSPPTNWTEIPTLKPILF